MIGFVLAIIHIIVCLILYFSVCAGFLKSHKYMFFVALLMPVWGPLAVLILHFQIAFDADDKADIGVEKLRLESELYKSIDVDEKNVADKTVPIEEALVVNSSKERRAIIMDVLNDNPREYIEFLQRAGNNDDTEVVHYAITAMVEISKENDRELQKFEALYNENPDDAAVVGGYCDFLWQCLSQNLMAGQVEVMNRELFSTLMNKKISFGATANDYVRLAENELKLKKYDSANDAIEMLGSLFCDCEDYITLKIQLLASLGKGEEIKSFIKETQAKSPYTAQKVKEVLAFWSN